MDEISQTTLKRRILRAMRREPAREWGILELCIVVNHPNTLMFRETLWQLIDRGNAILTPNRRFALVEESKP